MIAAVLFLALAALPPDGDSLLPVSMGQEVPGAEV
jgi:hypothetical protein